MEIIKIYVPFSTFLAISLEMKLEKLSNEIAFV
jgi:hypothetical protein